MSTFLLPLRPQPSWPRCQPGPSGRTQSSFSGRVCSDSSQRGQDPPLTSLLPEAPSSLALALRGCFCLTGHCCSPRERGVLQGPFSDLLSTDISSCKGQRSRGPKCRLSVVTLKCIAAAQRLCDVHSSCLRGISTRTSRKTCQIYEAHGHTPPASQRPLAARRAHAHCAFQPALRPDPGVARDSVLSLPP